MRRNGFDVEIVDVLSNGQLLDVRARGRVESVCEPTFLYAMPTS